MKALCSNMVGEKMMKLSPDLICTVDRYGYLLFVNEACKGITGYESKELINQRFVCFIHPKDCERTLKAGLDIIEKSKTTYFENCCIHKSGKEVSVAWSAVWSEEDEAFFCIGRNVTEQKLARQRLRERDEMYLSLIEHGSDILTLFDEELNYVYCGGSISRELGYEPAQLIGANAVSFIHPEDVPMIQESLSKLLVSNGQIEVTEFRFKDAKGEWRWLEGRASNQLHNPSIKALVVSSHDVTERIESRFRMQESEQRFKSLFEHHLDIVFFQNKDGVIIDLNAAALSFFGLHKEGLLQRRLSDFLTAEVIGDFEEGLQDALNGKPVKFLSTQPFSGKGDSVFDIIKVPVIVDSAIVGVYCIFREITEIIRSSRTIKKQAEKLNVILESITDAFIMLDRNWNFAYVNSEFEKLVGAKRGNLLMKNVWELTQNEIVEEFHKHFHVSVATGKTIRFETHFERLDKWMEVKAFPSEEGLSVFINDITERIKSKQELEKLSLVASKTTNGVVITDANIIAEWVNEGFTKLTGYSFSEVKGIHPSMLLQGEETDKATANRLAEKFKEGKPFTEEILNFKKSGEKVWLLLDVTPILNDSGKVTRYITLQTDITERKEAEERQLELTKDLYRQNSDLQQFTYIVSHNLRAPVANVMGLTDMLSKIEKDSKDFDTSLNYLKISVHKMDTVLRDLNTILSIRDKKGTVEMEKVVLSSVLQQVVEELQESLKSCGGEISMDLEESICVNGNKAYLYSILYNLLSNAIKFRSSERALKVNIKGFGSKERGAIISFSDNGLGFDREAAGDNLFKLYKRFHTHSNGRGIGLFLIKTHLEAMDGHIEVSSKVDSGTRFLIYLK